MTCLSLTLYVALVGLSEAAVWHAQATLPVEAEVAAFNEVNLRPPSRTVGPESGWRYVYHQGRWWYWSASERWSYLDGNRWLNLDLLNQPLAHRGNLPQLAPRRSGGLSRGDNLRFRFGELPIPRTRVGSFELEGGNRVIGRSFVGSFEAGAASSNAVTAPAGEPAAAPPNRYGPDSAYGPYGSTNPFRAGLHTGSGGNYGYGLGTQRPLGGYGRPAPHARLP